MGGPPKVFGIPGQVKKGATGVPCQLGEYRGFRVLGFRGGSDG